MPKKAKKSSPKKSKSKSVVAAPKKVQFHHVIVLDKSGSMSSVKGPTISGFNETVANIRQLASKDPSQTHTVTLVTFSDENQNVCWRESLASLKELNDQDYMPSGYTALCDAMGRTMYRMQEELAADNKDNDDVINVLLTVITDGEENRSKQYSASDISKMNEEFKKSSKILWTVTYIGANQDVMEVAKKYNISVSNVASYASTGVGTKSAFSGLSAARALYVDNLSRSVADDDQVAIASASVNFFSSNGPADFTKDPDPKDSVNKTSSKSSKTT
jgi:uncharacterized protein YegL